MNIDQKVVLVTGSAKRVGRAIALDLASRGARLAVHYNESADEAREVRRRVIEEGGRAEIFQADLEQVAELSGLIERVTAAFDRLDLLINNASVFERTPLPDVSEADWDRHLNINLRAPFFLSQSAAGIMRRQGAGKIINIADSEIQVPWKGYLPYCISKAALVTMTRGLARALAPEIQVNAIGPGTILPPDDYTEEDRERAIQRIPAGRFGKVEDIVRAVRFLIEDGDYVSGVFIPVDGGYSIR